LTISEAKRRIRDRRRRVWAEINTLSPKTIREIAAELGVSEKTIDRDIASPGIKKKIRERIAEIRREMREADEKRISELKANLDAMPIEQQLKTVAKMLGTYIVGRRRG